MKISFLEKIDKMGKYLTKLVIIKIEIHTYMHIVRGQNIWNEIQNRDYWLKN